MSQVVQLDATTILIKSDNESDLANHLVTLAIVDQSVNVQSHHAKIGLTVLPKTPNFTNDTERPTRKQYQPGTRDEPRF
jgi:hypothetical protein